MSPDGKPPPDLPDQLDSALAALWEGKPDALDRLVDEDDGAGEGAGGGAGPGIGELLGGAVGGESMADKCPPTVIAEYEIVRELGRGGMGIVYEARQRHPERLVAVKVVRGGGYVDTQRIKLFHREVQTLARLKHPNIAAIYDAGRTDDGQHFFAMELVRGATLTDHANGSTGTGSGVRLDRLQRLRLFLTICDAINYAHQRGGHSPRPETLQHPGHRAAE